MQKVARSRSPAGARCSICRSPDVFAISGMLAAGVKQKEIAKKYPYSQQVISRHLRLHMRQQLLAHDTVAPVLTQIRKLNTQTLGILADAEDKGDPNIALQAIRESRHNLELIAKLTGQLKSPEPNETTRVEIVYVDKQLVVT